MTFRQMTNEIKVLFPLKTMTFRNEHISPRESESKEHIELTLLPLFYGKLRDTPLKTHFSLLIFLHRTESRGGRLITRFYCRDFETFCRKLFLQTDFLQIGRHTRF